MWSFNPRSTSYLGVGQRCSWTDLPGSDRRRLPLSPQVLRQASSWSPLGSESWTGQCWLSDDPSRWFEVTDRSSSGGRILHRETSTQRLLWEPHRGWRGALRSASSSCRLGRLLRDRAVEQLATLRPSQVFLHQPDLWRLPSVPEVQRQRGGKSSAACTHGRQAGGGQQLRHQVGFQLLFLFLSSSGWVGIPTTRSSWRSCRALHRSPKQSTSISRTDRLSVCLKVKMIALTWIFRSQSGNST